MNSCFIYSHPIDIARAAMQFGHNASSSSWSAQRQLSLFSVLHALKLWDSGKCSGDKGSHSKERD